MWNNFVMGSNQDDSSRLAPVTPQGGSIACALMEPSEITNTDSGDSDFESFFKDTRPLAE